MKNIIYIILMVTFLTGCSCQESDNKKPYTITTSAQNGYVTRYPDQESYAENQKVKLISRPMPGYKFACWTGSAKGSRLIAELTMNENKTVEAVFEKWAPPIGIPEPVIGIFETYRMYDEALNRNPSLTYLADSKGGYYTHYVDQFHPDSTDSNNNYGTMLKPRKSFPESQYVEPGSIILIGGDMTLGMERTVYYKGTLGMPVFFRGAENNGTCPSIDVEKLYLCTQYLIFENMRVPGKIYARSFSVQRAYRNTVRNVICKGLDAVSFAADNADSTLETVFYGNDVCPNYFDPEDGTFKERDVMGIGVNENTEKVWMLDNHIYLAGGDAAGSGHRSDYTGIDYFIGRNVMHTCGENAVDAKGIDGIVVSQNVMFDFKGWSSGSDGTAIVFHKGPTYSAKNAWVLYNEIFDSCDNSIQTGGDQVHDVYIIGNYIHDSHGKEKSKPAYGYRTWSSLIVHFINNVIHNVDFGVSSDVQLGSGSYIVFKNNIVSNVSEQYYHLSVSGNSQVTNSVIDNNVFIQPDGTAQFRWALHGCSLTDLKSISGQGAYCYEGDNSLLLDDGSDSVISVKDNSEFEVTDAGENNVYVDYDSIFYARFGVHIMKDYYENERIQDGNNDGTGTVDIGAVEK